MLAAANAPDPALLTVAFDRAQQLGRLRQAVAEIERGRGCSKSSFVPLGVPGAHDRLASLGLACGVLHEVIAATHGDRPAAFGFMFALTPGAAVRAGPALLIATQRSLRDFGKTLRPRAAPAGARYRPAGAGRDAHRQGRAVGDRGDASIASCGRPWCRRSRRRSRSHHEPPAESRRRGSGTPFLLLRAAGMAGTSAAATRWRIAAAPAARDRFGASALAMERDARALPQRPSRASGLSSGDHVAHRFRLAEGMADCAPSAGAGLRRAG